MPIHSSPPVVPGTLRSRPATVQYPDGTLPQSVRTPEEELPTKGNPRGLLLLSKVTSVKGNSLLAAARASNACGYGKWNSVTLQRPCVTTDGGPRSAQRSALSDARTILDAIGLFPGRRK